MHKQIEDVTGVGGQIACRVKLELLLAAGLGYHGREDAGSIKADHYPEEARRVGRGYVPGEDIVIGSDGSIVLIRLLEGGKFAPPQHPFIPLPGLDAIGQGLEGELLVGVGGYLPDIEGVLDGYAQGGPGPDICLPVPGKGLEGGL